MPEPSPSPDGRPQKRTCTFWRACDKLPVLPGVRGGPHGAAEGALREVPGRVEPAPGGGRARGDRPERGTRVGSGPRSQTRRHMEKAMRPKRQWSQQTGQITIERDGKTYTGTWTVDRGVITVRHQEEERTTHHTGGVNPEPMARQLLREILDALSIQ